MNGWYSFLFSQQPKKPTPSDNVHHFQTKLNQLQRHDTKLVLALAASGVAWYSVSTSFFPSILSLCSAYLGKLLSERKAIVVDYRQALQNLLDDFNTLKNDLDGQAWRTLLADKKLQTMIKTLAPFVPAEQLQHWHENDLKAQTLLGNPSEIDRDDIDANFLQLLRDISSGNYQKNWQYQIYGIDANHDFLPFIQQKLKEVLNKIIPAAVQFVCQSAPPTDNASHPKSM